VNYREQLLANVTAGDTLVLRSLTHLLAFRPADEVARLLLGLRQALAGGGGVLLATLHADCVDEWLLAQLQPLFSTVISVERESINRQTYPKICTVTHR
jgi:archaellum biogenesis ATPase FlaH